MNLKGLGVAMITPFKNDGSIDFQSIPGIIEILLREGSTILLFLVQLLRLLV